LIEQAYRWVEAIGLALWCQDEAGPYPTVPYPGENWQPRGEPARQAHEYVRNGTAKLLTLFRPHTGEVRAKGVRNALNTVLHPWLQEQLTQILATLPAVTFPEAERPALARWETWLGHPPRAPLPPLRVILVWDNLAGHLSYAIVRWLFEHGIMPLNTPLSGSWLNMAESLQRIIVRRALAGQHPQTPDDIIAWLEETVAGWNQAPTPFVWDGKRRERRRRARARRLGGSAATLAEHQLIAA
jgi:DDE superfamily endonuclease